MATSRYFGLHYDLHAGKDETDLGTRCGPDELRPMLEIIGPDFVQTDCKGHAGYTSWFSKTPDASVPPGLRCDALARWRETTRELGLPLHCHYSGVWDTAAGEKHPDWQTVAADGAVASAGAAGQNAGADGAAPGRMCPRGPYLEKLLIPQMLELVDRYGVDGFWVDGDVWGAQPCYCPRCRAAYTEATGKTEPPTDTADPDWPAWWSFTRDSFEAYVRRYADAVHEHAPGVRVCSNWLYTFNIPGEPSAPVDWISGDNAFAWGVDGSRCETRFISTRGKPWDLMFWTFYCTQGFGKPESPWCFKPAAMMKQEAAMALALGGGVQLYETASGVRDGRLIEWRAREIAEVRRFAEARRDVCEGGETFPQIAVLHSEHHLRARARSRNLMHGLDVDPVRGMVYALLESHFGVDVLDEWALLPRLAEFPVVAVPERDAMSDAMQGALVRYVENGGRLLLTGAEMADRFPEEFLGAAVAARKEKACYYVPGAVGVAPLYSDVWALLEHRAAQGVAPLFEKQAVGDDRLPHPGAVLNAVGAGRVAWIPAAVGMDFHRNRYLPTRQFVGHVAGKLAADRLARVEAPAALDVVFRRKDGRLVVHFVNRASGLPNTPSQPAVDEIPPLGPVRVELAWPERPARVASLLEGAAVTWDWADGALTFTVDRVALHEAVAVDRAGPASSHT